MEREPIPSGNASFEDCSFFKLRSESDYGGAIYFTSGGSLVARQCSFIKCESFCGGGIAVTNRNADITVDYCSFIECSSSASGGGFYCNPMKNGFIRNSNFSSCITSHIGAGCFLQRLEISPFVESCLFQNNIKKTTSYFGGCGIGIQNKSPATIKDCLFSGGQSENYGGGISWDTDSGQNPSTVSFCFFEKNYAAQGGHDVYIHSGWDNVDKSSFILCRSLTDQRPNRVMKGSTDCSLWIPQIYFSPIIVDSSDGIDHLACGSKDTLSELGRSCKTIGFFSKVADSTLALVQVEIKSGTYLETFIQINDLNVSMKGEGMNETNIIDFLVDSLCLIDITSGNCSFCDMCWKRNANASNSGQLFSISEENGILQLQSCKITSSNNIVECPFSSPIMSIRTGNVTFLSVLITSITQQSCAVISLIGGATFQISFQNVEFTQITRHVGNGSVIEGHLGQDNRLDINGGCLSNCFSSNGCGGGICVCLAGDGEVVVNGACVIDGCEAVNVEGKEGRGGGLFVEMESEECLLTIGQNVEFSKVKENVASYGKDVFVSCSSGILLESKVNTNTFEFFDSTTTPSDVLRLSGSEDGKEDEVIPLFVYLCSMGSKLIVDGSGEWSLDHSRCGFEKFGCLTIDYCVSQRANINIHEIEVASVSSLKNEMKVASRDVSLSGKIKTVEKEGMRVDVSDEGSMNQNSLIECIKSLEMSNLLFVLNEDMNGRRSSFIHSSSSTITITSCSISFESGALTDGKIGYSIIDMAGGNLIVDGFVMEGPVTMNGKSPITMTNGVKLEILNSRVSEVEVTCGNGGGCLNVEIKEGGSTKIEECNLSSVCSGGNGIKGGGIMISVGNGGSMEMKNVKLSGCKVPREDVEEGGKGMGGGMFVRFPEEIGSFVIEGMEFEGCNAWKGKNVFVSGWDLIEIVNKENFKWEMSSEELGSLDELCGWERKTTGEGYVIPLVVYLWDNWSGDGFVSVEKGGDFSGCGYSVAPCSSIDHLVSLRFSTLETEESKIIIFGSGLLRNSMSFSSSSSSSSNTPVVKIEGEEKGSILRVSEMDAEGDEESMIASDVHLSFVNLSLNLPSELGKHSSLIHSESSPSSSATLSIMSCSFACEDKEKKTKYCILKACRGFITIEDCSLSQFTLVKGFLEFMPEVEAIDMVNVTITDTSISGRSLISLEEETQSNRLSERGIRNTKTMIRMNYSSFTNITSEENRVCVVCVDSFSIGVKCVMEGCVLTKCTSMRSEEGGGVKMCLKSGESDLKVSGCSFVMCECSTGFGRGGGMMIDSLDPNVEANPATVPPLGLKVENIRFVMNDAFVGKDVFINCFSITEQVNETLFVLDFSQDALKSNNSICGRDDVDKVDVDLIPLITFYYSAQVFLSVNGNDSRQCGAQSNPCQSVSCSVKHIEKNLMNVLWIDGECVIGGECQIGDMRITSMMKASATIYFKEKIEEIVNERSVAVFVNECIVEKCRFVFGETFEGNHENVLKEKNGRLEISVCWFSSIRNEQAIKNTIVSVESGELKMSESSFSGIHSVVPLLSFCSEGKVEMFEISISNIKCEGDSIVVGGKAEVEMKEMKANNISLMKGGSAMKVEGAEEDVRTVNCSFSKFTNSKEKGNMIQIREGRAVRIEACAFDGEGNGEGREKTNVKMNRKEICGWNGSLIDAENSNVEMRETIIRNSKAGGLWVSGGCLTIEKGEFENNNPFIEGYPSARRNAICTENGELNVVSVKGGDGIEKNASLWILDEGCKLGGIAAERASPFFIPVLEDVKNATQPSGELELIIHGKLLLPCDLSVKICMKNGDEEEIVRKGIDEDCYASENEIHSIISSSELEKVREETEVSMCILFGKVDSASSTESFVLKNKSEAQTSGNERVVKGEKKERSIWPIIVIVLVVILLIVLIISIIVTIRWRKQKRRTEELEIIVEDTVKKDPKLIEMMTMEMSPEERWRRAEREAEKKNDERIKKRIYERNMEHSESSEHLLSESDSTEYILGRDSDKIPEWMLEKVDDKEEEDETRKRSPSPSISSTSSTSTTDSDSTFVRGEDLCPTTSSMSNLVDAMACSVPHEKLIVDLRDSLFMLLHGRNEKKEMAIGTLQERELTGAQILFWVANGALHSFDEMENPLSSLANLSPHIVLFSEHMVITIAMHSDCSSDSDSDSSSISSSTVATSASDDDRDSLPSSAFEDEDDNRKECMRWKAPELLMNNKMGATKKTTVFSIGMMLWECLTLKVPFGEYEAEMAGWMIKERGLPNMGVVENSQLRDAVCSMLQFDAENRPRLRDLKREFIRYCPASMATFTVSDAIGLEDSGRCGSGNESVGGSEITERK